MDPLKRRVAPHRKTRWTMREIDLLTDMVSKSKPWQEIADTLNRPLGSVTRLSIHLNIKRPDVRVYNRYAASKCETIGRPTDRNRPLLGCYCDYCEPRRAARRDAARRERNRSNDNDTN